MVRKILADAHLTYIAAGDGLYDVYPNEGGSQLGTVQKMSNGSWVAFDPAHGPPHHVGRGRTRWEAALVVWPGDISDYFR